MPELSEVLIFDLSSVPQGNRTEQVTRSLGRRLAAGNNESVVQALSEYPLGDYGQNGPTKDFLQRLLDSGRLSLLSPANGPPLHLYFFDGKPLIGFMPPFIRNQLIDGGTATVEVRICVLKPELMPTSPGDQRGLKAVAFLCALHQLAGLKDT